MYKKQADGTFLVRGNSGKFWTVSKNMDSCNCPKFKYYLRGQAHCHHITEVIMNEIGIDTNNYKGFEIWDSLKYREPLFDYEFFTKYGEQQFLDLVKQFKIIMIKNRVRKL